MTEGLDIRWTGYHRARQQEALVAKGLKRSVSNLEVDDGQYLLVLPESPDRLLHVKSMRRQSPKYAILLLLESITVHRRLCLFLCLPLKV